MRKALLVTSALATSLVALPSPARAENAEAWVNSTLSSMSLRDKVAQMVMPYIEGGQPKQNTREWKRVTKLVKEEKVGGLIIGVGPARTTAQWLNALQRMSGVPLLMAADLEWGAGTRLRGATNLPVNMALAAADEMRLAYEAGWITALEARAAGIHMAFAPVADVNVNPANPVINTRSYGAEPARVSAMVSSFIEGARAGGVLTAAKHFPGHGDVAKDSHLTLPFLLASRERIEEVELAPFRAAIGSGVSAIMTAHLAVPALDPDGNGRPATLSPPILTGVLRNELDFRGLIVTDALNMEGAKQYGTTGEVAVAAVVAGADILLMPPSAAGAIDAVVAAVHSGQLRPDRIDASVRRILLAKAEAGLHQRRTVDLDRAGRVWANPEHRTWAQRAAERSVTVARNYASVLPLPLDRGAVKRVLLVEYDDGTRRALGEVFATELGAHGARVERVRLSRRSGAMELNNVERRAADADVVIFASWVRSLPWKGTIGLPDGVAGLADRLAERGGVVVSFGNPYILEQLPNAATYVLGWSDAAVAQRAVARAITGRIDVVGKLPIPIPPYHRIGDGIALNAHGLLGNLATIRQGAAGEPLDVEPEDAEAAEGVVEEEGGR